MTEITLVPLVEGEYLSTALQTENPNLSNRGLCL